MKTDDPWDEMPEDIPLRITSWSPWAITLEGEVVDDEKGRRWERKIHADGVFPEMPVEGPVSPSKPLPPRG